jgi:hypothetical protein
MGQTEAEATGDAIVQAYNDHIKSVLPTTWRLYSFIWRNVSVAGSQGVEKLVTPVIGTGTDLNLLPPQIAALVSFRTGTPPPNTSRKYLGPFSELFQDKGTWNATVLTALQAWGNAIVNIGSGLGDDRPIVAARINPQTGLAEDTNPLTMAIARPITATMRSRRIGVGI